MKKSLLFATILIFLVSFLSLSSETIRLEVPIIANGDPVEVELDDGTIITVQTSSDDAEQENDEMDALDDDDIDAGWEGDPEDFNILTCGLRFQNITIPKGAIIVNAYIEVTSHEAKTADDVAELTIVGEAADNPATYDYNSLITDRTQTNAKVEWTVDEEWGLWTKHQTVDISSIVQELVNRDGWQSGNAMAFMFLGEDQGPSEVENAREFEAYENISDPEDGGDGQNHPDRVPMLVVEYEAAGGSIDVPIVANGDPVEVELDDGSIITVQTSSDDAEQENDAMDALDDDDIDAGWEGDPEDFNILTCGLRFQNIQIPQGALIESAVIEVTSHEAKTADDVAELIIVGEAADNAATYDYNSLITDRPQTNAKVNWTVAEEWGLWTKHKTIDFSPVVQEIVNRPGWQMGNALAIMFLGQDQGPSEVENAREFEAYENISDPEDGGDGQNHPERVPRLQVTWSMGTSVKTTIKTESLNVYPNPVENGSFVVDIKDGNRADVRLYDQSGKTVKTMNHVGGNQLSINVDDLSNGVYILEVKQDNTIYTQKIIVN